MPTISEPWRTRDWSGIRARRVLRYNGPASYPAAGGDPFTPGAAFLGIIECFGGGSSFIADDANGANPRLGIYTPNANPELGGTIRWFVPNTGAEVAGATNLSGYAVDFEIIGKG